MSHAATQFPAAEAHKLSQQLQRRLSAFSLAPGAAAAHVNALMMLANTLHGGETGVPNYDQEAPAWFKELAVSAGAVMGAYVKGRNVNGGIKSPSDEQMTAAMFTIGELAAQCNTLPPNECQTFIQALVAPGLGRPTGEVSLLHCFRMHASSKYDLFR